MARDEAIHDHSRHCLDGGLSWWRLAASNKWSKDVENALEEAVLSQEEVHRVHGQHAELELVVEGLAVVELPAHECPVDRVLVLGADEVLLTGAVAEEAGVEDVRVGIAREEEEAEEVLHREGHQEALNQRQEAKSVLQYAH